MHTSDNLVCLRRLVLYLCGTSVKQLAAVKQVKHVSFLN